MWVVVMSDSTITSDSAPTTAAEIAMRPMSRLLSLMYGGTIIAAVLSSLLGWMLFLGWLVIRML
jgi:hypothetical protein